jgi:hypothetical protein
VHMKMEIIDFILKIKSINFTMEKIIDFIVKMVSTRH